MAKKSGLGSGLGALFGDAFPPVPEAAAQGEQNPAQTMLPISKVEPRADQPRRDFDPETLAELTDSIRRYGVIQPITVRPADGGYYQIIAGERRWRAARDAGLDEVPVRIVEADDREAMELALVENLQREDLNPVDEALGYRTLIDDYGLTQEEAASAVGKSRVTVTNALRLLNLSKEVLSQLEHGALTAGHARALLTIRDALTQRKAAQLVVGKRLSVRQTELLARRMARDAESTETPTKAPPAVDYVREVERELENALGRKVKLVEGRNKGHISIEFYGADDREKLIENLRLFSSLRTNK